MNTNAACPILSAAAKEPVPCKKEECAWYATMQCVVFSLNTHLADVVNNTSYIYVQDTSQDIVRIRNTVEEIKDKLGS